MHRPDLSVRLFVTLFAAATATAFAACGADATSDGEDAACVGVACGETPDTGDGRDLGVPDATPDPIDVVEDIDTAEPDIAEPDADVTVDANDGSADTGEDTAPDVEPDIGPTWTARITSPRDGVGFREGDLVRFEAEIVGLDNPGTAALQWLSSRDGFLSDVSADGSGFVAFETSTLSAGNHVIELEATVPGDGTVTDSVEVAICGFPEAFPFDEDLDPAAWYVSGDAYRDARGWLEMTGDIRDQRGAIINIGDSIAAGDIRISFDISTGHCSDPGPCSDFSTGADGFAVSIFETATPEETIELIAAAQGGGGLGYGLSGGYGPYTINAFHIEFDTWYNQLNDAEYHTDPTTENHVGITLNGDPGNHILWAPLPTLENNEWHSVSIAIVGTRVTIEFDGEVVADQDVPDLTFKGGFLAFTGVTGFYSNYHRFDNLVIAEQCEFRE